VLPFIEDRIIPKKCEAGIAGIITPAMKVVCHKAEREIDGWLGLVLYKGQEVSGANTVSCFMYLVRKLCRR